MWLRSGIFFLRSRSFLDEVKSRGRHRPAADVRSVAAAIGRVIAKKLNLVMIGG
jgi:hypothetical protein